VATEKDIVPLNLAGLSTRMLGRPSTSLLGVRFSAQEVSNALHKIVPAAKAFLTRPLGGRRWMYLDVDGTYFRVRRATVDIEPTLVVLGVDDAGRKSLLSMLQGDKDSRAAWEVVFRELKERGLDPTEVQAGIMDGLPGLGDARNGVPK
jgi:putative transposase